VIRKYGRIDAPKELVRSIFIEPEDWPLWFPGVEEVAVIERTESRFEVEIGGHYMGRRMHGRMDCTVQADGMVQRQLSGWLKKWDTHWRFLTPPDGRGTTLACEVDLDLGVVGVFAPSRMIHSFVGRVFADTVDQVNRRALELLSEAEAPETPDAEEQPLLQVFETPDGLEIWVAGRRYLLEASD
jgi:carbon monoxide dehydrogenase subunit G